MAGIVLDRDRVAAGTRRPYLAQVHRGMGVIDHPDDGLGGAFFVVERPGLQADAAVICCRCMDRVRLRTYPRLRAIRRGIAVAAGRNVITEWFSSDRLPAVTGGRARDAYWMVWKKSMRVSWGQP